ncbi:MAG: ClpX C4-type zinc finger protein, partial [Planctomycetota bacterium]|nr:ClpX C4-type zinc finger protein [Planctomycetota bacterium]
MAKKTSTRKPKAICSFCGKSASQADTLIEGPNKVFICPECVELCHNIIRQDRKRPGKSGVGFKKM